MLGQKTTLKVLGKSRHNFIDEKTNRTVIGAKIFVEAYIDEEENNENKVGMFPTEINIPFEKFDDFYEVPGVYSAEMHMKAGSKGQFVIRDIQYTGEVILDTPLKTENVKTGNK